MEKSKKLSFTSIAIVVLAILLTISLTMGGTLAWFANQNSAETTLTMGNAVGVAVVDANGTNGSMDRLSFQFNTGRNGELMLPGAQVNPDVRALIAKSNTDTILRAVVTFEVTLNNDLTDQQKADVATAAGSTLADDGSIVVPSSVAVSLKDGTTGELPTTIPSDPVQRELFLLNELYSSFFATLQSSALYNGWVYRESNIGVDSKTFAGSSKAASTKYYVAGLTQYDNTAIVAKAGRNAGPGRTQETNPSTAATGNEAVSYNAFYFRGWSEMSTTTPTTYDASHPQKDASGNGWEIDNRGIDGYYYVQYAGGSKTGREDYIAGTGRQYYATRTAAGDSVIEASVENEYAILEGILNTSDNTITKHADPLGYRAGDITANGATSDSLGKLNVSTAADSWRTSGRTADNEDMMCVLNTLNAAVRVPLFTTSFNLPTTWTQDAFADRTMRLNVTFQVMQADYLASGSSHHCSVELAESRFDDVTVWATTAQATTDTRLTAGQPYVRDAAGQPNFNNPDFWKEETTVTPEP